MGNGRQVKIFIFVNLAANGGKAAAKWGEIRPKILTSLPQDSSVVIVEFSHRPSLQQLALVDYESDELQTLIIGGGDGTLNFFFNHFTAHRWQGKLWWGAIALGRNNLFHCSGRKKIQGVSCLLNFQHPSPRRLGQVIYSSPDLEHPEVVRTFHSQIHLGLFRNLTHEVSLGSLWYAWKNWQNFLFQIQLQTNGQSPQALQLLDLCISCNGRYTPGSGLHTPWPQGPDFFYLFFVRYQHGAWPLLKYLSRPYFKQLPEVTYGEQFSINPIGLQTMLLDGDEVTGKRIEIARESCPRIFLQ